MSYNNNDKLFSRIKDLYSTRRIEYDENIQQKGFDLIPNEILESKDFTNFVKRVDTYTGLFSSQQLFNLDFDLFENHTFFDSAIAKVNYVFDKILNEFPYDGTYETYTRFIRSLDGYTAYILNNKFPKSFNSIYLDNENYIEVVDKPGFVLKEKSAEKGFLNPKNKPMEFDFWINIDNTVFEDGRIIAQKIDVSNNVGFTLYLNTKTENSLNILITNSKGEYLKSSCDISYFVNPTRYLFDQENQEGYFHVCIQFSSTNINSLKKDIKFFLNGKQTTSVQEGSLTQDFIELNSTSFNNASMYFGFGNDHIVDTDNSLNVDSSSLNASIDEFRFFHKIRLSKTIIFEKDTTIFPQNDLVLYFKFNEPSGSYRNNFLVLDSSGNKIHGQIKKSNITLDSNQVNNLKIYKEAPIKRERDLIFPVMFPSYDEISILQQDLLEKADEYDSINPNIIFNMFPKHYFVEGSDFENKSNIFSNQESFTDNNNLGIQQPATQEFVNILLIWARFFDELKCYIDNISEIINTDYDDLNNKSPFGVVVPLATKLLGFEFKNILPSPTTDALDGRSLSYSDIKNNLGIRKIQNEIWKRILINSQDFLRSKGTINSIKSILNSAGIEADKFVDIKEYSGKNKRSFSTSNRLFSQETRFIDFGDLNVFFEENTVTSGIPDYKLRLSSDFIYDHFSPNPATSGSFMYEAYYCFNETKKNMYDLTQSLCLVNKENKDLTFTNGLETYEPIISLTFERSSKDKEFGTLKLKTQASSDPIDLQEIEIDDLNLINGELWHISFGRRHVKDTVYENLLYIKPAGNKKYQKHHYIKKRQNLINTGLNNFTKDVPTFFSIGLREFDPAITSLGPTTPTLFEGEVSNIRFYNTELLLEELIQRSEDITYLGFKDSLNKRKLVLNYDFTEEFLKENITTDTLRLTNYFNIYDKSDFEVGKQAWPKIANIDTPNQSQKFTENIRLKGILITKNTRDNLISCIKRKNINIVKNDIRFDDSFTNEKIKINSFQDESLKKINEESMYSSQLVSSDLIQFNDLRISIEHSNVKYLNQDISKMIGSIDFLSKAYGISSNLYDTDYVNIKAAREIYFEKLFKEIDFKPMQQVFKYFDNILSKLIEDSIPSKINYMGFNYVYESHGLERHKYEYKMSQSRIPIEDEGYEFPKPVINSPRTEQNILDRMYSEVIDRKND